MVTVSDRLVEPAVVRPEDYEKALETEITLQDMEIFRTRFNEQVDAAEYDRKNF
jgi:hypothetical protein